MKNILYLDCFSGISGDMMIGALLDIGLDFDHLSKETRKLGMDGYQISHKKVMAGGGPVVDFGVHFFDMARYYCGEIEEVEGITKIFEKVRVTRDESGEVIDKVDNEVDDTFIAITKFKGGAVGQFSFS